MGLGVGIVVGGVRVWGWAAVGVVAIGLGVVQVLSSIVLRERARDGAWVEVLPVGVLAAVDRLDPRVPIPPALRLVMGRAALAARDLPRAREEAALLGTSRDAYALEAGIAEAMGDGARATAAYLAAGDLTGLETRVDALAREDRFDEALALQHAIVARLRPDRTQADALAEAFFGLGRLEERRAYALAVGVPQRHVHELRARDAYAAAVEVSPLAEHYLLALGNQQLNVAELDAAVRTFERARDLDPTSADPIVGFGDAAARRGDRTAARAYLARARALDPRSEAVGRLAREIGS